jgi:endo-1,4-beta-mannosidase
MRYHHSPACGNRRGAILNAILLLALLAVPASARAGPASPASPPEIHGVNYIRVSGGGPACAELMFGADGNCPWDQAAIDADMRRLRGLGVNTVRVFLNYYAFGGAAASNPAYDIRPPLAHLDALIASASDQGIAVLPVLLAKYPQDRFDDAGLAEALRLHVAPVVAQLAGKPGLLGWDLFNEPDIGSPIDERCWDWDNADFPPCHDLAAQRIGFLRQLAAQVRRIDPGRPLTIGMAFAKSYFRPADLGTPLADAVDFYSFHYYDDEPHNAGRYAQHWYYGQGLPADLRRAVAELAALTPQRPVLVSELGFPSGPGARRTHAMLRSDLQLSLEIVRAAGGDGVMLWPFQPDSAELIGDLFAS